MARRWVGSDRGLGRATVGRAAMLRWLRRVAVVGVAGLVAAGLIPTGPAAAASAWTRLAGTDRYATAVAVAQAGFPHGAPVAVVATGTSFPDALAADYLAGQVGGPVLLTEPNLLPAATSGELSALGVSTVYVVGGLGAVSASVASAISSLHAPGGGPVTLIRLGGTDRYATAALVAGQVASSHVGVVGGVRTALLATGTGFADALAGSAAAAGAHLPMLLTSPTVLSPQVLPTLRALGVTSVVILGGTGAVSATVATALSTAGLTVSRLGGADRTATATLVASWETSTLGFTATAVAVARGDDAGGGVDALALGVLAGLGHEPLLLAASPTGLGAGLSAWLSADTTLTGGVVAGGAGAISPGVLADLGSLGTGSGGGTGALAVATSSLPTGTVGTAYSAPLQASGGVPAYTWTITSGTLPAGLSLDSATGVISGTPSTAGSTSLDVQVSDSASPAATATAPLSLTVYAAPPGTAYSPNWSGYVVGNGPYTAVTGTFTVPTIYSSSTSTDTGAWVGIDGSGNSSLIQAGIGEPYDASTNTYRVRVWWEILPAPMTIVPMTVSPGDRVTVTIGQLSGTLWGITLTDDTTGRTFTTDRTYTGPLTSAEWIVEAPTDNGVVSSLGGYTPDVTFSHLGFTGPQNSLTDVIMVQNGVPVSTPSALDPTGFTVAYGATAPGPP
ncbi:MAG: G1 family glutamic endopeptidase [Actinomycetes bacterium]